MPGPGTSFVGGPVLTGTHEYTTPTVTMDMGVCVLTQTAQIVQNGTAAVSVSFALPIGSQVIDILSDTTVVWNSGTSDTLSVGTIAAGTTFASGVSTAATGRVRPTFTAAQLAAMQATTVPAVVATVTPVGTAATTGTTDLTLVYAQTVQTLTGTS